MATPGQVRQAWTLHQAPGVLAIPGTGPNDKQRLQWELRDKRLQVVSHPLMYRNWPDDPRGALT